MGRSHPVITALNAEWRDLSATAQDQTRTWALLEPELTGAQSLDDIFRLVRRNPDPVLGALLRLGAAGHQLAHRVVLQTMLGALIVMCAGRTELLGEGLSELWIAITEYPKGRPRSIAANIYWRLFRSIRPNLIRDSPLTWDPPAPEVEAAAGVVLDDALALGLIDETAHRTLATVYLQGLSSKQAGKVLGMSPEVVRWRCSTSLRRLARSADLLSA